MDDKKVEARNEFVQSEPNGCFLGSVSDLQTLRNIAEALWQLLDDIDTSSDVIKPSTEAGYKAFYNSTMTRVDRRFQQLTSDGYNLYLPVPVTQVE